MKQYQYLFKMNIKKFFSFVPNTITSLNILSGALSVVFAFEGELFLSGIFILLAAVFDFFDGMSARLLRAYSAIGKELDSLADVISFGFAPSVIAHCMMKELLIVNQPLTDNPVSVFLLLFLPFFMLVFSALRLAKFNIDERQSDSFIGLPTPANAIVWAAFPIIKHFQKTSFLIEWIEKPIFIIGLSIILGLLLVSELHLFSLKFKNLNFAKNKLRFLFLGLCLILFIVFKWEAIPLSILAYILLSVFHQLFSINKHKSTKNE